MIPKLNSEWRDCSHLNPNHDVYLKLTTLQAYDEGPVRLLLVCCTSHVVFGAVMYVILGAVGNRHIRPFRCEDVLKHECWDKLDWRDQPVCRTGCKSGNTLNLLSCHCDHHSLLYSGQKGSYLKLIFILSRPYAPIQWLNNHSTSETGVFQFLFLNVESRLLISGGIERYFLLCRLGTYKLAGCRL